MHDGRAGRITDDTQMTLFTAERLIRAVVRAQARGICAPEGVVHHERLKRTKVINVVGFAEVDQQHLATDALLSPRVAVNLS